MTEEARNQVAAAKPENNGGDFRSGATTERDAARGLSEGITLRYIDKLEAENERLRREIDSLRPHVEGIGYAG